MKGPVFGPFFYEEKKSEKKSNFFLKKENLRLTIWSECDIVFIVDATKDADATD